MSLDQDHKNGSVAVPAVTESRDWTRDKLAWAIFLVSALGIIAVSITVISAAADYSERVFSALVPLFGTWVGTILAFYFARENFESASSSLRNVVDRLTPEQKLRQTRVRAAMIPRNSIKGIELSAERTEDKVTVHEICHLLTQEHITRIPVFDSNESVKYVIHESMIYKYIADNAVRKTPIEISKTRLTDFLSYKNSEGADMRSVVTKIAYVAASGTLADARDSMADLPGCQDVIVTANGKAGEVAEGWLTNIDIMKHAQVS